MSDEIKPALTPEEWALDRIPAGPFELERATGTLKFYQGGADVDFLVQPGSAHEMAAVLLHGQPFGFTSLDLALLADLDALLERDYGETEANRGLRSLVDRIAALLPPRPGG